MAEVFLAARDTEPNTPGFVLKRCRDDVAVDDEIMARLKLEAQVAASHAHPNLVDLIQFGRVGDRPYLVMDYVRGVGLERLLQHVFDEDAPPPTAAALAIGIGLLEALAAMHGATERSGLERPILHRDVKPKNVIIADDGRPVLIDYGIALDVLGPRISAIGRVVGTPRYMAPERRRSGPVDARSDVFSASMILFELLTGRHPWPPLPSAEEMLRDALGPPLLDEATEARLPDDVRSVVMRGLSDDPELRWPNARAMAQALKQTTSARTSIAAGNPWGPVRAWMNATGLPLDEEVVAEPDLSSEGASTTEIPSEVLSIPPLASRAGRWPRQVEIAALVCIGVLGAAIGWLVAVG